MPTAWRILKTSRAPAAFDGEGARVFGGRWNSPGTAMVYASESIALAALELLVHLQASQLLASYSVISATFDAGLVEAIDAASLPRGWRAYPAPVRLQEIGDRWVARRRSAVLQVPSALVPAERNYLMNSAHPDFPEIAIGAASAFALDPRLK